jgi:hypothetical protein
VSLDYLQPFGIRISEGLLVVHFQAFSEFPAVRMVKLPLNVFKDRHYLEMYYRLIELARTPEALLSDK